MTIVIDPNETGLAGQIKDAALKANDDVAAAKAALEAAKKASDNPSDDPKVRALARCVDICAAQAEITAASVKPGGRLADAVEQEKASFASFKAKQATNAKAYAIAVKVAESVGETPLTAEEWAAIYGDGIVPR